MKFKNIKVFLSLVLVVFLMLSFVGCKKEKQNDIVVLFTNDVLCAVDENIGYSGLLSYKNSVKAQTPYVTLVDLGNAVQGEYIGTVSQGTHIVNMMNKVGYDYAVLGNHEFDYGIEQLKVLLESANAQYLNSNIVYTGKNEESPISATKPYEIIKYGSTKVAFIGVTTPKTLSKTTPSTFKENGTFVYDFKTGGNGNRLYTVVQGYVNECKNKGADFVVILSHLGDTVECAPYTSTDLIGSTFDVDVVLDAHAGSEISGRILKNSKGETVTLCSAGEKLSNIGKLVISANGMITTSLVSGYFGKDSSFDKYYKELKSTFAAQMNETVAICDTALKMTDEFGINTIKNRENLLGNFCADAYRLVADADIAMITADRISGNLPVGDVLYSDVVNLLPNGNSLCKVKATGQEIVDALEIASMSVQKEYEINGMPIGESDNFMQISGLRYTIDTSVESTVVFDDYGNFKEISGNRRVKGVQILNDRGGYTPINPDVTYTVASNDILVKEGSGGINVFVDNSLLIDEGMPDYQVIINYLTERLMGEVGGKYSILEGRIIVK